MITHERKLRFIQIGCVAYVLLSYFALTHFEDDQVRGTITIGQWLVVLGAMYSAVVGFTMQRKFARVQNRNLRQGSKSTPLSRWRAGNLIRLACATSVSVWAFVLLALGGPIWLANVLFGLGLGLLLIWRPGPCPSEG